MRQRARGMARGLPVSCGALHAIVSCARGVCGVCCVCVWAVRALFSKDPYSWWRRTTPFGAQECERERAPSTLLVGLHCEC